MYALCKIPLEHQKEMNCEGEEEAPLTTSMFCSFHIKEH